MSAESIRQEFQCARSHCPCKTERGNVHCPGPNHANGDQNPSLSVKTIGRKDLLRCHAGCENTALIAILRDRGLWNTDESDRNAPIAFAKRPAVSNDTKERRNYRHVATYQYRDETGAIVSEKGRFEWDEAGKPKPEKEFKWKRVGDRDWYGGITVSEQPLFGADLVAVSPPSQRVIFCEGENAALAARTAGLLAVCQAGGAGTTDFGKSLDVLAGREVLLWPDNDVPGRKFMVRVHAALRPIAHSVVTLQPTVDNEGDDAVEYFAAGGTVEQLIGNLAPLRPSVRYVEDDAITVDIPSPIGCLTYEFSEILVTPRDMSCEIEVSIRGPGQSTESMPTRINVLSASSVTEFRRNLDAYFPPPDKAFWTVNTTRAISLMRNAIRDNDGTTHISQIEENDSPGFLVDTLIPDRRPTMFFGDGESAKTWMALRTMLGVGLSGEVGKFSAQTGPTLFLDWETEPATWKNRVRRMAAGMAYDESELFEGSIHYRRVKGLPFSDIVSQVRAYVEKHGIRYVIIDSLSAACGGPLADDVVAQRFINAYARLGQVAMLAIAHVPKDSDTMTPFGSIMWRNFFRMLWYVQKDAEEGASLVHVGMYNRKYNDGPRFKPVGFDLTFEDTPGTENYIVVEDAEVKDNPVLSESMSAWSRIEEYLFRSGRATLKELAKELQLKEPSIRRELSRHKDRVELLAGGPGRGSESAYGLIPRSLSVTS